MATFVDVTPTLVENTIMRKRINDTTGVPMTYRIEPIDGYVLHDRLLDIIEYGEVLNPETGEVELVEVSRTKGYSTAEMSMGVNYDFTPVQLTDEQGNTVYAYGEREFFAVPQDEVPSKM